MKSVIDFEECVRDTPLFRSTLDDQIANVENLDSKLEKLLKFSNTMIETGKTFLTAQHAFSTTLTEVSVHFRHDQPVYQAFSKCNNGLMELAKFHSTLLDQVNRAVCRNVGEFLRKEVRPCKETKSSLEKIHSEYESAILRNSAIPKGKSNDAEEAFHILNGARVCFRTAAIETVYVITMLQQRKRFEILDNILSVMNAQRTYFHQGTEFFKDNEDSLKLVSSELNEMRAIVARDAEGLVENRQAIITTTPDYIVGTSGYLMQGYLFRRCSGKTFKSWKKRWFSILDKGQLIYRKRSDEVPTVMEDDLRICLVRPMADCDRRFCFELISPSKTHILQADSEDVVQAWVTALQAAIQSAIQNSTSRMNDTLNTLSNMPSQNEALKLCAERAEIIKSILSVDGNNSCCDCNASNPEWASVNLGVTLCIECSGIHRSLGVHLSKVKSLTLDTWDESLLKVMCRLGNSVVNKIYLAKADVLETLGIERATPTSPREIREVWVRAKYVDKAFVTDPTAGDGISRELIQKWKVKKPERPPKPAIIPRGPPSSNAKPAIPDPDSPPLSSRTVSSEDSYKSCASRAESDGEMATAVDSSTTLVSSHPSASKNSVRLEDSADESDREFDEESMTTIDANMLLYKASKVAHIKVMCEAIALGANTNWVNKRDGGSTPLHQATYSGSITACEFLILNGARINCTDANGRTPIWCATDKGETAQVCLFCKYRADFQLADLDGKSPLDIAVAAQHADIVTLLRCGLMEVEMRVGEVTQSDDTFQEIVRDIAKRAMQGKVTPSTGSTDVI